MTADTTESTKTTVGAGRDRRVLGASGVLGAVLLIALVAVTALAPWIAGDPLAQDFTAILRPPSPAHPFGTDELGRDVLARVVHGGRSALILTAVAAVIASGIGVVLAVATAVLGGAADAVAGRVSDVQLAVPSIVLAIVILTFAGNSFGALVLVLVLGAWVLTFRVVRTQARAVVAQPYVEAARVAGAGRLGIVWWHVLPSILPLFLVSLTLSASAVLLFGSSLGFLGLGVQPPAPDWGQMVAAGQSRLAAAPWLALFPGLAIITTVIAFQLLGDGLAERFGTGRRTR